MYSLGTEDQQVQICPSARELTECISKQAVIEREMESVMGNLGTQPYIA